MSFTISFQKITTSSDTFGAVPSAGDVIAERKRGTKVGTMAMALIFQASKNLWDDTGEFYIQ